MTHTRRVAIAVTALLIAVAAIASAQTDWVIPVPEGTQVFEYEPVPLEDRGGPTVSVEPEVVIGGAGAGPNALFYRASDLDVDPEGRMYILDSGNHRVQVFDPDGGFVMSLGGRGQGPGELTNPSDIAVSNDRVLVWDRGKRRVVTWDLSGRVTEEITLRGATTLFAIAALPEGDLVVFHRKVDMDRRIGPSPTGAPVEYLVQHFTNGGTAGPLFLKTNGTFLDASIEPNFAVGPEGNVYVSAQEEYQVHTFSPTGNPLWAMRIPWERFSTRPIRERRGEMIRLRNPEYSNGDVQREIEESHYPEFQAAIFKMNVDGHGHLWVIPRGYPYEWPPPPPRPNFVDVFSADGELLFSGTWTGPMGMGGSRSDLWEAAVGDYVYYGEFDEADERRFVRARLIEAF